MDAQEQADFEAWIRDGVSRAATLDTLHARAESHAETAAERWGALVELGVAGLNFPESVGGADVGQAATGILLERTGATLLDAGHLMHVAVVPALLRSVELTAEGLAMANRLSSGTLATWAHTLTVRATEHAGDHWRVDGTVPTVIDADCADVILIVGQSRGELSLFGVSTEAVTVSVTANLDPTRPVATVTLDDASATKLADISTEAISAATNALRLALASEAIGTAQTCLKVTVEHAKTRKQFGRPIGAFQAVKHRCADAFVDIEAAAALLREVQSTATKEGLHDDAGCLAASSYATKALVDVADTCTQVHGGVGITWEAVPHFFVKRAKATQLIVEDLADSLETLSELVLGPSFTAAD